jgi:hypothetical protein
MNLAKKSLNASRILGEVIVSGDAGGGERAIHPFLAIKINICFYSQQ